MYRCDVLCALCLLSYAPLWLGSLGIDFDAQFSATKLQDLYTLQYLSMKFILGSLLLLPCTVRACTSSSGAVETPADPDPLKCTVMKLEVIFEDTMFMQIDAFNYAHSLYIYFYIFSWCPRPSSFSLWPQVYPSSGSKCRLATLHVNSPPRECE